jgi:hypothetical protein
MVCRARGRPVRAIVLVIFQVLIWCTQIREVVQGAEAVSLGDGTCVDIATA